MDLRRVRTPPPHETLQAEGELHEPQTQSVALPKVCELPENNNGRVHKDLLLKGLR